MGQKKKTTTTRKAKFAKAGPNRKPYVPVMRRVVRRERQSPQVNEGKENPANIRRGTGSNKEEAYTGYPTSYYR